MSLPICFKITGQEYGNVRLCDECGASAVGHIEQIARLGWRQESDPRSDMFCLFDACPTCSGRGLRLGNPLQVAINRAREADYREQSAAIIATVMANAPRGLLRSAVSRKPKREDLE